MCASHLKLNCTFTRYHILTCRGRSEKGQGISEKRREREREREGGRKGVINEQGYPLLLTYFVSYTTNSEKNDTS